MRHIGSMVQKAAFAFGVGFIGLSAAISPFGATPASAQTIIDDWQKVKPPAAPELKPVTVDLKTTALLILDFNGAQDPTKGPCNKNTKPRCLASVPKVKAMLDEARAKGVFVVYSLAGVGEPQDIATDIAPLASDPIVKSGADKFIGTQSPQHPRRQGHQDRDRHWHGRRRRGSRHGDRCCTERHEHHPPRRRHVVHRTLRRAICSLAYGQRARRFAEDNADQDRHDQVLRHWPAKPKRHPASDGR